MDYVKIVTFKTNIFRPTDYSPFPEGKKERNLYLTCIILYVVLPAVLGDKNTLKFTKCVLPIKYLAV